MQCRQDLQGRLRYVQKIRKVCVMENPKDKLRQTGKKLKDAAGAALSSDAAKKVASHAKAAGQKISSAAKTAANSETAKKVTAQAKAAGQKVSDVAKTAANSEAAKKVVAASKMAGKAVKETAEAAAQTEAAQRIAAGAKAAGKAVADSAVGQATVQLAQAAAESAAGQKVQEVAASVQQAAQKNKKVTITLAVILAALIIIFIAAANAGGGHGKTKYELNADTSFQGVTYKVNSNWEPINAGNIVSYYPGGNNYSVLNIRTQGANDVDITMGMIRNGQLVESPAQADGGSAWMGAHTQEDSHITVYILTGSSNLQYVISGERDVVYDVIKTMII